MKKLLIVDDSKAMRLIIRRALRQAGIADHTVDEAANGAEALQKLTATNYDLVLADWNMPEMNGMALLNAVKAQGISTHFGFITSQGTGNVRAMALENGADFFIMKPFTSETVCEAVKPLGFAW